MWLVVGLGNPGDEYAGTRHNAGFMLVDRVAGRLGLTLKGRLYKARTASGALGGAAAMFLEPSTFMNLSGEAVLAASRARDIPPSNIVVVYDDLDLPVGSVRVRASGSAGTHKGMKSITSALGTTVFPRVRIGIGPKPESADAADFVLDKFRRNERADLEEALAQAEEALELILAGDIAGAMTRFNRKNEPSGE